MRDRSAESRVNRDGPRAELRAEEPLYLIPDKSPEAVCRAWIAADIDWVSREAIILNDYGMLVPACIYEVYWDLVGYPVPCCSCGGFRIDFGFEGVAYVGDQGNRNLIGMGFSPLMKLYVNGALADWSDDWGWMSPNVIDFWGLGGYLALGETYTYEIRLGDQYSSWTTPPAIPAPADATLTSLSPSTIADPTEFTLTLFGTNLLHSDMVALTPPGQYFHRLFPVTFVTDTEVRCAMWWPQDDPEWVDGAAEVRIDRYPLMSSNALPLTIT